LWRRPRPKLGCEAKGRRRRRRRRRSEDNIKMNVLAVGCEGVK
jgi:hypothetical protein